jgi:hypothetical protein
MSKSPVQPENNFRTMSPKIVPIAGTLEYKRVKCGRQNCHCARGELHHGYAYLRVQVNGQRYRRYVKKADLPNVLKGIELHRQQQKQQQIQRQEFNDLMREMRLEERALRMIIRQFEGR